jgi:MFS family permease
MGLLAPVRRALRLAFEGRDLGWSLVAWGWYIAGEQGLDIALVVYAYDEGGVRATGVLVLFRSLVSAITAPFTAGLGDRYPRRGVLVVTAVTTGTLVAAMGAAVVAGVSHWWVYGLAILSAVAIPVYRPVQAAMLPRLALTPAQLTAGNVVVSMLEGFGNLAGPLIAGGLFLMAEPSAAFLALAAFSLLAAIAASRIAAPQPADGAIRRARGRDLLAGFITAVENADVRVLMGTFTVSMLVWGAFFQVLLVAVAVQRLGDHSGSAGVLASAAGVGAILGAAFSAGLVGRRHLVPAMVVSVAAWSAALIALALTTAPAVAYAMVIVPGAGLVVMDVVTFTLLQRAADDEVLARVFGVLESLMRAAIGLGAVGVAILASRVSLSTTLITVAALQPLGLLVVANGLRRVDRLAGADPRRIEVLRSIEVFSYLTAAGLERIAAHLQPIRVKRGEVLIQEGDCGDQVILIDDGAVEVRKHGTHVADLGAGSLVGEIALIRDVPRTATVTATTDCDLYALGRDEFLRAVSGETPAARETSALIETRLNDLDSLTPTPEG